MRPDLMAYVKALSLADKKSITQKVLKLMEESGELAKAALPFENAYATTHRFVTRQQIDRLRTLANKLGCPMSRNIFKRTADQVVIMLTYRDNKGTYETVKAAVDHIGATLRAAGFDVDKEIIEFSLYDTKVHHDAAWLAAA